MNLSNFEENENMTPPAIITYDIDANDDSIEKGLRRMLKYECSFKRRKDVFHFYTRSKNDYETLIKYLQFHEHGYYTHLPPWHNIRLMVLKDYLGSSNDAPTLIAALKRKGIECLGVHIMKRKPGEYPFPARLLTLAGNTDLEKLKNLRYIGKYGGFSWADYVSDKYTPLQCSRCQRFRHDSRFCYMPPNCHTCGEQHFSKECKLTAKDPRKCFNCQGEHAAYESHCPEWISYKKRLVRRRQRAKKEAAKRQSDAEAEESEIASMCYDYETTSISLDCESIPMNGESSSVASTLATARPYKLGYRRSTKNK